MTGPRHPADCAHCAAVRRRHPADCAHCEAVRRPHPAHCRHCRRVRVLALDFRAWREAAELAREAVCYGHATEEAAYGRLPTFRDYLRGIARGLTEAELREAA